MRSIWIEHKGKKIFYQNFSKLFYNGEALKAELNEVQEIVVKEPMDSVLVLTDLRDTQIGADVLSAMNAASARTKSHVHKTAVIGVTGIKRTLGDTSDIVTKEMYSFTDRGGEMLTLRPEGTAGVARAMMSGGLTPNLPLKFFYNGPMFRYERPQKGRMRQFHQIGVELLGVAQPLGDIEVIALGVQILRDLGILASTAGAEHPGRRGQPAILSQGAGRVLHRPSRPPVRGQPRPPHPQSAADPRF